MCWVKDHMTDTAWAPFLYQIEAGPLIVQIWKLYDNDSKIYDKNFWEIKCLLGKCDYGALVALRFRTLIMESLIREENFHITMDKFLIKLTNQVIFKWIS